MKLLAIPILLLLLCGCTVRGGFPRFLRKGEASDGAIAKEMKQREQAKIDLTAFLSKLDTRGTETLDLVAVGKSLVKSYGADASRWAVWDLWGTLTTNAPASKVCDVIWLQGQRPRVRDVAWLLCYKDEWLPKL